MVDFSQSTPFVGVVNNDRQKSKAPRGTTVEVRVIKEGKYGVYALCFIDGQDKPVFLKPANIDYVEDVSDKQLQDIAAEKTAWAAERNTPVVIGAGEVQPSGKSVLISIDVTIGQQSAACRAFFPISTVTEADGEYSAPPWLAKIKATDAAYYWLSDRGTKGVDHLGGARDGIDAVYGSGLSYDLGWQDLQEAKERARS